MELADSFHTVRSEYRSGHVGYRRNPVGSARTGSQSHRSVSSL